MGVEEQNGTIIQRDANGVPVAAATTGADRTADQASGFLEVMRFVMSRPASEFNNDVKPQASSEAKTKKKK